jgi:hypothetical protein
MNGYLRAFDAKRAARNSGAVAFLQLGWLPHDLRVEGAPICCHRSVAYGEAGAQTADAIVSFALSAPRRIKTHVVGREHPAAGKARGIQAQHLSLLVLVATLALLSWGEGVDDRPAAQGRQGEFGAMAADIGSPFDTALTSIEAACINPHCLAAIGNVGSTLKPAIDSGKSTAPG